MISLSHNYRLMIAYDGTEYCGWQVQHNAVSIQQLIQAALERVLRHPISLIGSGRTDAGVHALGQVAHFRSDLTIDLRRLMIALNGLLPKDIRILSVEEAALDFHAQRSAKSKIYHYHLCLSRVQLPFTRRYRTHIFEKVDLNKIEEALAYFIGTHDFTSFTNEAHDGAAAKNAVRTIQRLEMHAEEGGVRLEFQANGFLYKMVRNIVGMLLDVSTGKRNLDEIPLVLAAKDRKQAGRAAPPQGLFLVQVNY